MENSEINVRSTNNTVMYTISIPLDCMLFQWFSASDWTPYIPISVKPNDKQSVMMSLS